MAIIPVSCDSNISVRQLKEVKAKIERFFTDRMSVRVMDNLNPSYDDDSFVHIEVADADIDKFEALMSEFTTYMFDNYLFAVTRAVNPENLDEVAPITEGFYLVEELGMWDEFFYRYGKAAFIKTYGKEKYNMYATLMGEEIA